MSEADLFVTDIEQINDRIEEARRILLYDTVAVSSHKLAYLKTGGLLLPKFAKEGDVVMLTETVQKELENGDVSGLYRGYLQHFAPVLVVKETDFIHLLDVDYHPAHAKAKLKEACIEAFSTIQPLKKAMEELDMHRFDSLALDQYESTFASVNDANKGEYSLLWLSLVLRKRVGQALDIRFLGMDNDLFEIVERCYSTPDRLLDTSRSRVEGHIDIVSTEAMLQGLYRLNGSYQELDACTEQFRVDLQRRIWIREVNEGILSRALVRLAMQNADFVDRVSQHQMEVVY